MSENEPLSEYLVLSRGKWDRDATPEEIQESIDTFYLWLDGMVAEGKMKTGQRLGAAGKSVSRQMITDGPFGETKEVIGGYWFVLARNLEEAAEWMRGNPTLQRGLIFEIRPIEKERGSAFRFTNETPDP